METIIRIKKNKPAFKALILLAKELEKSDKSAISINQYSQTVEDVELIAPSMHTENLNEFFEQLTDFPDITEIREKAWPKNL